MKILVPCKRVPDTDQKVRVLPDQSDVERANLSYLVNPFDAIALEEALRIRETRDQETHLVAVSIGPAECENELRTALAMGADRAILVRCDETLDPWNVSSLLVEVVKREAPDLVMMGKQAVDDDANQTGQFLAARLGWPQATFVSQLELSTDSLQAARETDAGIQTIRVRLPAVVTADLRLNEPRYASLPSIMKARKKPIEQISYQDLGVAMEPRLSVLQVESVAATRSCVKVADVDELLHRLKNEAKVI